MVRIDRTSALFIHANVLDGAEWELARGVPVEVEAVESYRGPKAVRLRVLPFTDGGDAYPATLAAPVAPSAPAAQGSDDAPSAPSAEAASAVSVTRTDRAAEDDDMCDVLSERDLAVEATEMLLHAAPDLTAGQILAIRRYIVDLARRHGWVEA